MTPLFSRLASSVRKRALYRQTVAELRAMPLDVALDLDLHRDDAADVARRAVYGR